MPAGCVAFSMVRITVLFKTLSAKKFGDPELCRLFVRHKSDGIIVRTLTNRAMLEEATKPK